MTEKIWYEDLVHFLGTDNYYHIIPMASYSLAEKLNAVLRFFLYLGILLAIVNLDSRYLFFGIIAAIITIGLYQYENAKASISEKFLKRKGLTIVENAACSVSTKTNPFANVLISDYDEKPDRPAACSIENERIESNVKENFNDWVFRDVKDIYNNRGSQRQFYTMPNTTIPNNQTGFAEWLFGVGPGCKEGDGPQCERNRYRSAAYHY